jgi:hypothetical protein
MCAPDLKGRMVLSPKEPLFGCIPESPGAWTDASSGKEGKAKWV